MNDVMADFHYCKVKAGVITANMSIGNQAKPPPQENIYDSMKEDLDIFEKLFGYRSLSVIPPHYIFTPDVEKVWRRLGIRYIQGAGYRLIRKSEWFDTNQIALPWRGFTAGFDLLNSHSQI